MGNLAMFLKRALAPRDERGSLIVVMAVVFVLVLLCSAVGFEVVGNQQNVLAKSNSAASVSAADAGLSDAVFRLDQLTPGTGSAFCMDSTGTGTVGGSNCVQAQGSLTGVSYVATPNEGDTVWTIQSKATVRGVAGAVQQSVSYSAKYPFAIFGNGGLDFNGQSGNTLGKYDSTTTSSGSNPDTATADCKDSDGDGNPVGATGTDNDNDSDDASCVNVGSNGPIKCAGGLPSNVGEVYYTGGGGASQCSDPIADPSKYVLTIPTAPTSGSPLTCPGVQTTDSNGDTVYDLGSAYPGWGTIGTAGDTTTYYCKDASINMSGTLQVEGTVLFYIILDATTNNTFINNGTSTLYISGGSEINTTFNGTSGPPPAGTTLPDASALQIMSNSTGTVGSANGGGTNGPYTYGGVIYAPDANLVGNGCKSAYYGSLTINTLSCNGGPHLQVYYDSALSSLYGPPSISGYAQINPLSFTVP
jgi:Tfp pilus assembly protein PilX